MIRAISKFILMATLVASLSAQNNWRCVFNPSLCGGPTTPPDRTELCDLKVPEAFTLIYGPAPSGPGCTSVPEKVDYFTKVQSFVEGSRRRVFGTRFGLA